MGVSFLYYIVQIFIHKLTKITTFKKKHKKKTKQSMSLYTNIKPKPIDCIVTETIITDTLIENFDLYQKYILPKINVNYDTARHISEMPQHIVTDEGKEIANPEWLTHRKYRITGSICGSITGNNPYETPDSVFQSKVFGSTFKGSWKTERGNIVEPYCRQIIEAWIIEKYKSKSKYTNESIYIEETGIIVNPIVPFIGVSPDGIIHIGANKKILLEIKAPCPFKETMYTEIPYKDGCPPYYMDQVQCAMGILGLPMCLFVQYFPTKLVYMYIPYDDHYFKSKLYPCLRDFYFKRLVPAWVDQMKDQKQSKKE